MELFPILLAVVIGGVFGAAGKGIVKSAAKGYMALTDRTRAWTANAREDLRDAVEEARYERSKEIPPREAEVRRGSRQAAAQPAAQKRTRQRTSTTPAKAAAPRRARAGNPAGAAPAPGEPAV